MNFPIIICAIIVASLFSFQEPEVSAQVLSPGFYGGGPLTYKEDNDDDIGILLAILLLAARNRGGNGGGCGGGGYCCCCNCNNSRTVPVPYPIPFPTNNPIIAKYERDDTPRSTHGKGKKDPREVINFVTDNDDDLSDETKVNNEPKTTSSSGSSSASSSASKAKARNDNTDIKYNKDNK